MKRILLFLLLYTSIFSQFNRDRYSFFDIPVQKEALDLKSRMLSDGATLNNFAQVNQDIYTAKSDGSWTNTRLWLTPDACKKDGSNYISKLYNLAFKVSTTNWVVNGGFDADANWTKDGQTISNGVATWSNLANGSTLSKYSNQYNLKSGFQYQLGFTVTGYSAGSVQIGLMDKSTTAINYSSTVSANGTYTFNIVCPGAGDDGTLYINNVGTSTFSIDNVTVFEVLNPDLEQSVASSQPQLISYVNNAGQTTTNKSILFDGTNDFLKTAAITLNQPEVIYINYRLKTSGANKVILDGLTDYTGMIRNTSGTTANIYAGSFLSGALNIGSAMGLHTVVFNGATSYHRWNNTTSSQGSCGTANMSGFTVGSNATGSYASNIEVGQIIILNSVPTTQQDTNIKNRLMRGL